MAHGDDLGLRLPPRLAPTQVVVVLVRAEGGAPAAAERLVDELRRAGHRATLDARVEVSFGRRAVDWELKGVPVRVEVGPRDLASGHVTVVRRTDGGKRQVPLAEAAGAVAGDLETAQAALLAEATERRDARTRSGDQHRGGGGGGRRSVSPPFPGRSVGEDGETRLAASGVSVRCLQRADGGLPLSDDEPDLVAICAKAY